MRWFPGYGWSIVTCEACGKHLGWHFQAQNRDFQPQSFFGLVLDGLTFFDGSGQEIYVRFASEGEILKDEL